MTGPGRRDLAIAAALFAAAMAVGASYSLAFERSRQPPEPWVRELAAAIAFACGRGYADPGYAPNAAVGAFLEQKIDRLKCAEFPSAAPLAPPNFTQSLYRYMTMSVALTWRAFGVSWPALAALFGVLYGVSAVAVYGMFRLATNRAIAAAGTLVMTMSPLQLRFLPQLRDYAKAPFILTLILILALLVVRPFTPRRVLALAAAYGAVMGIGFGFRNDLLINVLPFVVTIAFFLPVPLRAQAGTKIAALALCAMVFVVSAWPIISAYRGGSNTSHVALLGLMTSFDGPLGVTGSVYDWGAPYDDGLVMKMVGAYAERVHHKPVVVLSNEYERVAIEYLTSIARHWPADLVVRSYAAMLRVLELPFQVRAYTTSAPPALVGSGIASLYAVWDAVWSRVRGIGVPLSAIAIIGCAAWSVRIALWLVFALIYFAGYPAIQFDSRHFFFLEFIPWLALALVAETAWRVLVANRVTIRGLPSSIRIHAGAVAAFAVTIALLLGGTLVALRAYQQRHVTALIDRYLTAPADVLTLHREPAGDRTLLLRPMELAHSPERRVRAEYLAVDVSRHHCEQLLVAMTLRYHTLAGYTDLSERVYVPPPQGDTPFRLFFPIYYSEGAYFDGVEVAEADAECVAAMRRVTDLDRMPVLVNLMLPPDWTRMPLYQTLTNWERPSAPYRVRLYAWPRTLELPALHPADLRLPDLPSISHSSMLDADANGRWVVSGFTRAPTSFLVRLPPRPASKGDSFIARGTLYRGGFTLGLLRDDLWVSSVNVTAPGEFLAIVEAPEGTDYVPALANFLTGINLRNDFIVTAAGWTAPR